jgi:hypothetical protein
MGKDLPFGGGEEELHTPATNRLLGILKSIESRVKEKERKRKSTGRR